MGGCGGGWRVVAVAGFEGGLVGIGGGDCRSLGWSC